MSGNQLARLIAKAIGLDLTEVRSLRIDCRSGEPATIEIERSVRGSEADRIATELVSYELHEKPRPVRETTALSDEAKHYSR